MPDDPKHIPSWVPRSLTVVRTREEEPADPHALRRARIAGACLLVLGSLGVAIGAAVPEASMEFLLGALLIVLAVRGLFFASPSSR